MVSSRSFNNQRSEGPEDSVIDSDGRERRSPSRYSPGRCAALGWQKCLLEYVHSEQMGGREVNDHEQRISCGSGAQRHTLMAVMGRDLSLSSMVRVMLDTERNWSAMIFCASVISLKVATDTRIQREYRAAVRDQGVGESSTHIPYSLYPRRPSGITTEVVESPMEWNSVTCGPSTEAS